MVKLIKILFASLFQGKGHDDLKRANKYAEKSIDSLDIKSRTTYARHSKDAENAAPSTNALSASVKNLTKGTGLLSRVVGGFFQGGIWGAGAAAINAAFSLVAKWWDSIKEKAEQTRKAVVDSLDVQIRHVKAYESAVAKAALGEADWGRFIERYGIPPVHTVMPPGVTEEQKKDFQSATDDAKDGLCTTWPSGTSLSFAESARGVNPFAPFIEHCQKEILILATGGTLATLAEAGAGTLAGNAQQDIWKQIVARDAGVISDALNKSLFRPFLAAAFPGRQVATYFELGEEKPLSASDVFDIAAKAKNAGYTIEKSELEEATGYTLVPAPAQEGLNHAPEGVKINEPHFNAQSPAQPETAPKSKKIATPLESAIADIIAHTFAEELSKAAQPPATNAGTSEGAKKGWETRRRNGWTPEQLAENRATINSLIDDLGRQGQDGKGKAWKNTPKDLGEVSESLAADIREANPNMKATVGTMQTIDQKQLNHALIEHGVKDKLPSHIPITKEDLKRIPDVLSDYDDIVPGKGIANGKKQEAVIFRKRFDDGTICCVEIDWFRRGDKRHELKFQTMWKEKPEEI